MSEPAEVLRQLVLIESVEMDWGTFYSNGMETSEEVYWTTLAQYLPVRDPQYDWITTIEK